MDINNAASTPRKKDTPLSPEPASGTAFCDESDTAAALPPAPEPANDTVLFDEPVTDVVLTDEVSTQKYDDIKRNNDNSIDVNIKPTLENTSPTKCENDSSSHINNNDNSKKYIILVSCSGNYVNKVNTMDDNGNELFNIILNEWNTKFKLALLAVYQSNQSFCSYRLRPFESHLQYYIHNYPAKYTLTNIRGNPIAIMEFLSNIKLNISLCRPRNSEENLCNFRIVGEFNKGKYVIIEKPDSSRKQVLLGGSVFNKNTPGKVYSSLSVSQVNIQNHHMLPIILCGIVLVNCVRFPNQQ